MLSFSSIYSELQADMMQQEAKLEMFASNNFAWLHRIKAKITDPSDDVIKTPEQNKKECIFCVSPNQPKDSDLNSETSEAFMLSSDAPKYQTEEFSTINSQNRIEPIRGDKLSPEHNVSILSFRSTASQNQQTTPILKSCLRPSITSQNQNMDISSSDGSPSRDASRRHVSFGFPSIQDNDQQSSILSDASDSSELSRTHSPIELSREHESPVSNVTPQRSSVARQALHSSFDRISISSRSHDSASKESSPYCFESLTSESSASYFPSDSDSSSLNSSPIKEDSPIKESENPKDSPLVSDEKKGNSYPNIHKKIVFADINDIRLSLDPAAILLAPEELITPPQSTYSVAPHTGELSEQARINREKWAKMVQEKNKETTAAKEEESETDDLQTPYQLSDHDSDADDDDDKPLEEFDPQADEVHGKHIPDWARGEGLEKCLRRQAKADPDTIFPDFSDTCQLSEVFGTYKPRWQLRTDSAKWDVDGLTPEEIQKFKQSSGLL